MTVEGILRKSGKLRVVREIMHALDTSGGNDTVIDLAALCVKRLTHCGGSDPSPGVRGVELTDRLWSCSHSDPVTLADLFKQFLGALPDPLMTSHLFKLFIACSRASSRSHCVCLSTRGVRRLILAFFFFLSMADPDISHVGIRRRCMHLVVCMMPKTVSRFHCLRVHGSRMLNFCHRATTRRTATCSKSCFCSSSESDPTSIELSHGRGLLD